MVVSAQAVIAEHLDHPAVGDIAAGAPFDHTVQFVTQRAQRANAVVHRVPVAPRP